MTPQIRNAIIIIVAILVAVVIGNLIGGQNLFELALVVAIFMFVLVLPNPALAAFSSILFFYSGLTAPGIPGKLNFFYLSAIGLAGMKQSVVLPALGR